MRKVSITASPRSTRGPRRSRIARGSSEAVVDAAPAATKGGLHVDAEQLRALETPRWAVLVGVSRYQHPSLRLQYAHRDVTELWSLLQSSACGRFADDRATVLIDEHATTAAVTRAIRSFLHRAQPDDLVLIYFSGHSAPDPARPKNLYFLTHDTNPDDIAGTALPMREIGKSLDENLEARRVILLMDTCHSGAAGAKGAADRADAAAYRRYLEELQHARDGFAFFASSEAGEQSHEHEKWGGGHGMFTHLVLEGLRGKADSDQNGIVTLGELFDYVKEQTKSQGGPGAQHPLVGPQKFDRGLVVAVTGGVDARARYAIGQQVYRMAMELGDRRRFAAAARYLSEADDFASVERGLPEARLLAGLAQLGAGEPELAIASLRKAIAASDARRKAGEAGVPDAGYYLAAALAIQGSPAAAGAFATFAQDHPASPRAAVARTLGEMLRDPARRGVARRRALLVGVGTYRHGIASALRGPANDVELMRDALLADGAGFAPGDVRCLINEQATCADVRRELEALRAAAPDDVIVVYFSGRTLGDDHGSLVLHDTAGHGARLEAALGVAELHERIAGLPAHRVALILDTLASREHLDLVRRADAPYDLLVAASPGERAYEVAFEKGGQRIVAGLMTFALTQALAELGPSARWRDLVASLQRAVKSRGFAQNPAFVGADDQVFLAEHRSIEPVELLRASLFGAGHRRSGPELATWQQQVAARIDAAFPDFHLAVARGLATQGLLVAAGAALDRAVADAGHASAEASWWRAWIAARQGRVEQVLDPVRAFAAEMADAERARCTAEAQTVIGVVRTRPRRALVVGIDRYGGPEVPRLKDAVRDARAVADGLAGWGFEPARVRLLLNKEATTEAIVAELRALVAHADSGPLLFYFAGNGSSGKRGPTLLGVDARKEGVFDICLDELRAAVAHPNLTCVIDADTDAAADGRPAAARWAPVDLRAHAEAPRATAGGAAPIGSVYIGSRAGQRIGGPFVRALHGAEPPASWSAWAREAGAAVVIAAGGDDRVLHDAPGAAMIEAFLAQLRTAPFRHAAATMQGMLDEGRVNARDAWVDLGVARALCGDPAAAIAAFERAIAAAPDGRHAEARYHLGRVLVDSGTDMARAQSELDRAAHLDPDDPTVKYYLGAAIRGYLERESVQRSRHAQELWQGYLDAGAPLGHRDEVEAFLARSRAR
jgi:tetratricopeptide (TPR) repeat protein